MYDQEVSRVELNSPIYKTAIKKDGIVYAERYTNHERLSAENDIIDSECGFENTNGVWLNRKEAFIVALFNNQLNELALQFLAKRLILSYDLRESHFGLDSMWLNIDVDGNIV